VCDAMQFLGGWSWVTVGYCGRNGLALRHGMVLVSTGVSGGSGDDVTVYIYGLIVLQCACMYYLQPACAC
jgi:hypothetical protein